MFAIEQKWNQNLIAEVKVTLSLKVRKVLLLKFELTSVLQHMFPNVLHFFVMGKTEDIGTAK